jgi:hypothetical protein
MNRRVQRALDGEIALESMEAAELREVEAHRAAIAAALAPLAEETPPDVSAAVMWRVHGLQPEPARQSAVRLAAAGIAGRVRGAAAWLLTPQPVRLRPAAVFGVIAMVAAALALVAPEPETRAAAATGEVQLLVQFRISAEDARQVALVGTFSGWEGHSLEEVSPGVWSTTLPLSPGLYDYAFVIDGERWQLDPLAPAVADGFGGANSRIAVLAPEMRGL